MHFSYNYIRFLCCSFTLLCMSLCLNCFSVVIAVYVFFHPIATCIGGAFIVGTSEMMYTPSMGLKWTIIMFVAYTVSFIIGNNFRNNTCICHKTASVKN